MSRAPVVEDLQTDSGDPEVNPEIFLKVSSGDIKAFTETPVVDDGESLSKHIAKPSQNGPGGMSRAPVVEDLQTDSGDPEVNPEIFLKVSSGDIKAFTETPVVDDGESLSKHIAKPSQN